MKFSKSQKTILLLICATAILVLWSYCSRDVGDETVNISFLGWTNIPSTTKRFAIFKITTPSAYTVRWWGDWYEIEGQGNRKGRIFNKDFPKWSYSYETTLSRGKSITLFVGEPSQVEDEAKWRFGMAYQPYLIKNRLYDLALQKKVPGFMTKWIYKYVDTQALLNPTNRSTSTSAWINKAANIKKNEKQ